MICDSLDIFSSDKVSLEVDERFLPEVRNENVIFYIYTQGCRRCPHYKGIEEGHIACVSKIPCLSQKAFQLIEKEILGLYEE